MVVTINLAENGGEFPRHFCFGTIFADIICVFISVKEFVYLYVGMTKEEKRIQFAPKRYALYENGILVDVYDSHAAAKKAKHFYIKESYENWLDCVYEIKPY